MAGAGSPPGGAAEEASVQALVERINSELPQTQCTRCGYPDCRAYAQAIAREGVAINRCPPGGDSGITRLAALTGQAVIDLDPDCGSSGPRLLAVIDEAWCIGCTLCQTACPVDCIIGTHKRMHTVIEAECTGCELCVPACPVDCIVLEEVTPGQSGWEAWSPAQAQAARQRYEATQQRRARLGAEHRAAKLAEAETKLARLPELTKLPGTGAAADEAELARKKSVIEAALARARARRGE